jgi:hypothetical protein
MFVCGTGNQSEVGQLEGLIVHRSREVRHAKKAPFSVPQPSALDSASHGQTTIPIDTYGSTRSSDTTVLPEFPVRLCRSSVA